MVSDAVLQAGFILLMIFMFLSMYDIPRKLLAKLRLRGRADLQAKRHFVAGAQILGRARSSNSRSSATTLAKQAESEADRAIALDPTDAAAHILKALALDLQGFKTSALESFDTALSPPANRTLAAAERGDALIKRAELKMGMSRRGVESAIEDLTEALKLSSDNGKAFCLLGECYERKKMREEAKRAYGEALRVQPGSAMALAALDRLRS